MSFVDKRFVRTNLSCCLFYLAEEPALRFDGSANSQQSADFFSPLESAMLHWSAKGEESDAESGSSIQADEEEDEDVPTTEESRWISVLKKASGTLLESISPTRNDKALLKESENGRLSRSGSQASFLSARSRHSGEGEMSAGPSTPTRCRSFKDEPVSPGEMKESLKRRTSTKKQKRAHIVVVAPKISPVLEKLESCDRNSDFDSTAAPWTKMILLEELGTASSWTVLLLPYIAFIISILLDTRSSFMMKSIGPLNATSSCANGTALGPFDVPLFPAPSVSCFYPYSLKTGHGLLASGNSSYVFQTFHYEDLMSSGTAFTSGPIDNISPMSTFLIGDGCFDNVSTNVVALVARGMVLVSAVVLQRSPVEWTPVFVAKPVPLSMACIPNTVKGEVPSFSSLWNCRSPRIVDVVFPMPGTLVLSDGELQVNVLYSPYDPAVLNSMYSLGGSAPYKDKKGHESYVYYESSGANVIVSEKNVSHSESLVSHLVESSSYVIEHERRSYATVKISVRLLTLIVSFCFTVFWCWSLGCKGFFAGADCCCSRTSCWPRNESDEDIVLLTSRQKESKPPKRVF